MVNITPHSSATLGGISANLRLLTLSQQRVCRW